MTQKIRVLEQAVVDSNKSKMIAIKYSVLLADVNSITDQEGGDMCYIIDTGQIRIWDDVQKVWSFN